MTHRSTWKKFEREVAAYFGTHRVPLSGMSNFIQKGDILHDKLHVECKYRANWPKYVPMAFGGTLLINDEFTMWCKPVGKTGKLLENHVAEGTLPADSFLLSLFEDTEKQAAGKITVLALKKKGLKGFVLMCRKENVEQVKQLICGTK